jgi:hypothetical protein
VEMAWNRRSFSAGSLMYDSSSRLYISAAAKQQKVQGAWPKKERGQAKPYQAHCVNTDLQGCCTGEGCSNRRSSWLVNICCGWSAAWLVSTCCCWHPYTVACLHT